MRLTLSTIVIGFVITAILSASLVGCGRKGGLYLPENVKQDNGSTQSAPESSSNDEVR